MVIFDLCEMKWIFFFSAIMLGIMSAVPRCVAMDIIIIASHKMLTIVSNAPI